MTEGQLFIHASAPWQAAVQLGQEAVVHGNLRRDGRVLALELVSFCSPLKWRVGVRATWVTSFNMPIQVKGTGGTQGAPLAVQSTRRHQLRTKPHLPPVFFYVILSDFNTERKPEA